jgi:hydrogenase maturation factor
MKRVNEKFTLGKLKHEYLAKLLSNIEIQDSRVIMGSKIGEDAAIIDIPGKNYLVAKTDPITFATEEIGYYAVIVNVNDLVCTGAKPKWFQSTILLPENLTTSKIIEKIFNSIQNTCKSMGITVVGGHIEITPRLDRPIVVGSLIGEVEKNKLVLTSGAEPGDALILTKGIFIEGTSIIGREKANELKNKQVTNDFIKKCKDYLYTPGISVFKEALLANKHFKIKSCHDPTEGGLACGIAEMANLNPMGTISSGSLLIAVHNDYSSKLVNLLNKNKINADKIGEFVSRKEGLMIKEKDGKIKPLEYSETDEITKIF